MNISIIEQSGSCDHSYYSWKLHKSSSYLFLFSPQMRNWKRRYFLLEENSMSYFKSDLVIKLE